MTRRREVPFEENGVRVIVDRHANPIEVYATTRMSVEEAWEFIRSIERAIAFYAQELEKG